MATLLEAKAKRNLTWMEVSAKTGISVTSLSLISRGAVFPRAKNRELINKALGVEIDYIATRIRRPLKNNVLKKECPEDTVIAALYCYIKSHGTVDNRFEFLYEFLNKLETFLNNDIKEPTRYKLNKTLKK
ncbi:MAG: XRE family transcriptional regulator [Porphyromonadaceae bacterium]|nr:MAG: XRE family transcriptional regulator [Porphyromonadaceae bacterium]